MRVRRRLLLLALLLPALPGRGEEVAVRLAERRVYEVEGSFRAPVPRSVAWEVLTDYEHIGSFVPAVRRSWVADRKEGEALVGQDITGGWLFFTRRMILRLQVVEKQPGNISFQELSGKDFASYAGSWRLDSEPEGTAVAYRLRAEPRFHVPGFVLKGVLKREAEALLRGIRDEMIRRNGGEPWAQGRTSQPGS